MVRPVATSDHTTTKLIVRNGHGAYGRKKDDRTGENHQGQKRSYPGSIASSRRRGGYWVRFLALSGPILHPSSYFARRWVALPVGFHSRGLLPEPGKADSALKLTSISTGRSDEPDV